MSARLPIIPTILVIAAVATMIALGFWQLGRAEEKADMLARFEEASASEQSVTFPVGATQEDAWFRRSALDCRKVSDLQPVAGTAATGAKGWAMRATCALSGGGSAIVDLGFTRVLEQPQWSGGSVTGIVAPGPRLIADPPLAGLEQLAPPDPNDLPNNHLAYAGQWFFFALTALVIYAVAIRSRQRS